jgi:transcriptional regulator with GAF, ATPase, and Fis domain
LPIDVRFEATTNLGLWVCVAANEFRENLFF